MTEAEIQEMMHRLELLEATVEQQRLATRAVLAQLDKRLALHGEMLGSLALISDTLREFMRDVQAILGDKPDAPGDAEAVPRVEP